MTRTARRGKGRRSLRTTELNKSTGERPRSVRGSGHELLLCFKALLVLPCEDRRANSKIHQACTEHFRLGESARKYLEFDVQTT